MQTDAERKALAESLQAGVHQISRVSDEEMAAYPARVRGLAVPTSQGDARIFAVEADAEPAEARPLLLNFHGGGFIGKRMDRDELFCRKLACRFGALVLDVDYKLAPDYPYPAAVLESRDVAEWAVKNADVLRIDPEKSILVGHSSGGNLAAGLCLYAGQTGLFKPLCAVIDYAPLDLKTDPADKPQSICDMPASRAQGYNAKYISPEQAADPYVSPLLADAELLSRFPETLVITAYEDRLCQEGEAFAQRLMHAGVTVTSRCFTESIHGFVINRMCEWQEATALIFDFVEHALSRRQMP